MIKVDKERKCVDITTEEGTFQIYYSGAHDLHWRYDYEGSILNQPESKSFTISKDDEYLFSLIDELYNDVKNHNIFKPNPLYYYPEYTIDDIKRIKKENQRLNKNIKESEKYNPYKLFQNNCIEWHCDDFDYEDGSVLRIEKLDDKYIIIIEKSKLKDLSLTYSVRLRTDGSRYHPYHMIFMRMFEELMELDIEQSSSQEPDGDTPIIMKRTK